MQPEKQKNPKFHLKWPWDWAVYLVLILLLRLFAIPFILLIAAWNKKRQPDGPDEGYCLQRTRRRLARLLWALLFLFFGIACGVAFLVMLEEDRSAWGISEHVKLVLAGLISIGVIAVGLLEGYMDLRDALFPAKSRLAKSIRSQLSDPDQPLEVKELFAMVDKDIQENGQWFDRVAVGKEWVLGDDASSIARIRVVFGRDEIVYHHVNGRTQTSRIIELYVIDDRRQIQITGLRNPNELEPLLSCLKLRAPDALFRPYAEYPDYCGKSDDEWNRLLLDYQKRKADREYKEEGIGQDARWQEIRPVQAPTPKCEIPGPRFQDEARHPQMALTLVETGGAKREYHRITRRDVELAGKGLMEGKYCQISLMAGARYLYLQAGNHMDGRVTVNASEPAAGTLKLYETKCTDRQAADWLSAFFGGWFSPDFSKWKDITRQMEKMLGKKGKP